MMNTKRPWKAIESWAYSHDGTQLEVMRVVDSDNSDVLAKVHEGPANARLIAAAPELLSLVIDLYTFRKKDYPNDITFDDRYNEAIRKAKE